MERKEKDLFEDFIILRWVKWTKRQPTFNGSVFVRWNGKYTSHATTHDGQLMSLDGDTTAYHIENDKCVADYTKEQKELLEDVYWLEEIVDSEGFSEYQKEYANQE